MGHNINKFLITISEEHKLYKTTPHTPSGYLIIFYYCKNYRQEKSMNESIKYFLNVKLTKRNDEYWTKQETYQMLCQS